MVQVIVEQAAREGPCPACGVLSATVKDRPLMRIKDLPASGQRVELWWRKRRLVCLEVLCPRRSFTQTSDAIRPRARVTERLREQVAQAIAGSNRAVSEVAREYRVSWPTAHKALIAAAARWLPEPEPTSRLGIDETRFRSVRWVLDGITWKRSDPWLTSFVDCSSDGPGSLLGLAPGRTGGCVRDWLAEQTEQFRDAIELVVIDPSAPYASGIRAALPGVTIAVDKWHLVALANQMVHRGPATRHPGPARPPRHHRGRGLGEPATAAHRRRPPVDQTVAPAQCDARTRRSDRGDRRRLGGEGTAPDAAR